MKIFVLGNANRKGVVKEVDRLLPEICKACEVVALDLHQRLDLQAFPEPDLALVLGGDGAILRAARQMGYRQIPVLGVNLGHLGFLADVEADRLLDHLSDIVASRFQITRHIMFECLVEEKEDDGKQPTVFLGLNEVVFHTLPPFSILELDLKIEEELVTQFRGDGLIISTPIGSTAHALSAGGPILGQELPAFVITPICPHTLTQRPVVDTAEKTYTISLGEGSDEAALVIDGQDFVTLKQSQRAVVRKAPVTFGLVKIPGHSFFRTLRNKLHWGQLPNFRNEH